MKTFGKLFLILTASCGLLHAAKMYTGEKYAENYYGHEKEHLEALIDLQNRSLKKNIIYFAGDSALDNKHWVSHYENERQPPVNDLDKFIVDQCVPDVEYWLNYYLASGKQNFAAVNTAVETARLENYTEKVPKSEVQMTSKLIRNNITAKDYLVVNVGGNDVLLGSETGPHKNKFKSLFAPETTQSEREDALKFFINFVRDQTQAMISAKLVNKQKPKGVVICTFYAPSWDADAYSWSEDVKLLDGRKEEFLSFAQKIHTEAVSKIRIEGTKVISLPFYEHLTGDDFGDYLSRVEPSSQGGKKMAKAIYEKIFSVTAIENPKLLQQPDKNARENHDKASKTPKTAEKYLQQPGSPKPKNNSISLQASLLLGGLLIFRF